MSTPDEIEVQHPDEMPEEERAPELDPADLPELSERGDKPDEPVDEATKGS